MPRNSNAERVVLVKRSLIVMRHSHVFLQQRERRIADDVQCDIRRNLGTSRLPSHVEPCHLSGRPARVSRAAARRLRFAELE